MYAANSKAFPLFKWHLNVHFPAKHAPSQNRTVFTYFMQPLIFDSQLHHSSQLDILVNS